MEYKEGLKWLKSYRELSDHFIYLNNRIKNVKSINYEPIESNGKSKTINDLIQEKIDVNDEMIEIENAIENIDNIYLRMVLGYRFLQFKKIDEVMEVFNKSDRWVLDKTKEGIEKI